jgi:hypothetical protein
LGDAAHEREIVGDEDHRDAPFGHQGAEQLHDDGLDGDIQRRGHLVADEQVRLDDQGPGDRDALSFPAGQLVRIPGEEIGAQ